jgi:streptogramin lyase
MQLFARWLRRNGSKAKTRRSSDLGWGEGLELLESRELPSGSLTAIRLPPAPPGSNAFVDSIFRGPTGAVWVAEDVQSVNAIGQTTDSVRLYAIGGDGKTKAVPVPGNAPAGAVWATASDGSVWFVSGSQIGRRKSSGAWTLFPGPGGADQVHSYNVAAGKHGKIWFTDFRQLGSISSDGRMTTTPFPVGGGGIAVDAKDNVLVTGDFCVLCSGVGSVPTNIYQSKPTGQVSKYPFVAGALVRGPDGNVWFPADDLKSHLSVGRIATAGRFKAFIIPGRAGRDSIRAVIPGTANKLYFLVDINAGSFPTILGSITTSGHVSTILASNQLSQDQNFTVGRDANLWFQNTSSSPGPRIEIDRISLA